MIDESQAKDETLGNAKKFINNLKLLIDKIESDFESNEKYDQVAAIINALAINQCLAEYHTKAEEIEKMLINSNKLN